MGVRLSTFNAENLFARYRFRSNVDPMSIDGFSINDTAFDLHDYDARKITAKAIRETDSDIVCLQEVENIAVLERFNSRLLGGMDYKYRLLIDSHDPRRIDVAVLSRYPFTYVNTHRDERDKDNYTWLYSRDCLEVDVDVNGKSLSLYVNHFKSMMDRNSSDGRSSTRDRREEQVKAVAKLVDDIWKPVNYDGNFVVCGDFNDYIDAKTSLNALVKHKQLVNVVERLPKGDRWTHFWSRKRQYRQLDYVLVGKALAENSPAAPEIERRGMPWRADGEKTLPPRFDGVGESSPKASDHCPVTVELELL